jgi:hypothetical protein
MIPYQTKEACGVCHLGAPPQIFKKIKLKLMCVGGQD